MYQEDMINEFDGCGGLIRRREKERKEKERLKESFQLREYNFEQEEKIDTFTVIKKDRIPIAPIKTLLASPEPTLEDKAEEIRKNLWRAQTVLVGKVIPWSRNSIRTVARAGAASYYGVYIHQVELDSRFIKVKLMAMGEWNLPSPKSSLFCVTDSDTESWEELANKERQLQKQKVNYKSRFDRAEWKPQSSSRGFYEGYLVLPRSFLESQQRYGRVQIPQRNLTLSMRYAATTPWQTDYAVVKLLQVEPRYGRILCPRHKLPVPPNDPWTPVFPREVLERFQTRELERDGLM